MGKDKGKIALLIVLLLGFIWSYILSVYLDTKIQS